MLRRIQNLLAWLLLCCRRSLTDTLATGGAQRHSPVSVGIQRVWQALSSAELSLALTYLYAIWKLSPLELSASGGRLQGLCEHWGGETSLLTTVVGVVGVSVFCLMKHES